MFADFKGFKRIPRRLVTHPLTYLAWVTTILFSATAVQATVRPRAVDAQFRNSKEQDFPTDPFVRRQVRFWEAIFQKYKSNSVVIHDVDDPLAMVDVIDFDRYVTGDGKVTSIEDSDQTNLVRKYIDRYNIAVERFAKHQDGALKFGPIEQRLFEVYNREPQSLARLYAGNIRFRGQGGLSDTFIAAANRAQEFMPFMETTFRKYGLPITLTRLPFVESMFNLNARSKVGASGIWQFMPETAKEFMYVGPLADERNNPYKATHGAAQLFKVNYRELGTWPLAVTAYNHGRAGVSKAKRELGTSQLGSIINNYKSSSFGFASKNFYAEFLAAARTYDLLLRTGIVESRPKQPRIETLALSRPMSVREISRHSKLSIDVIGKLNPCLTSASLGGRSDTPLPHGYEIRLPKTEAGLVRRALVDSGRNKSNSRLSRR
jgi:membrane-bound lytic murein transglycosylase D